MKSLIYTFLIILVLTLSSLVHAEQKLVVYTVNYPLQYFAQQIGGEDVSVHFPAPADIDPAYWMPGPETLAAYQSADLILLNGAGYARWVSRVSLPRFKTVNTSQSFMDNYLTTKLVVAHSHGTGEDHNHSGLAFTTWLDFKQALIQAHSVLKALKEKLPDSSTKFEKNYARLERQLMDLDRRMQSLALKHPDMRLWASHPVYQYMGRRYDIDLHAVLWEPDVVPDRGSLDKLENGLKDYPSQWMLWEAEPLTESKKALQALGLGSLVFEPAANVPEKGDFIEVMKKNVASLEAAFP